MVRAALAQPACPQPLHLDIRVHGAELAEHELIALGPLASQANARLAFAFSLTPRTTHSASCSLTRARAETASALAGMRHGVSEARTRTGRSVHGGRSMLRDYGPGE